MKKGRLIKKMICGVLVAAIAIELQTPKKASAYSGYFNAPKNSAYYHGNVSYSPNRYYAYTAVYDGEGFLCMAEMNVAVKVRIQGKYYRNQWNYEYLNECNYSSADNNDTIVEKVGYAARYELIHGIEGFHTVKWNGMTRMFSTNGNW